jgi:tetratricopeptide (TPR) repeat protein/4-amino-4-deoxy-L-arabinose transferase-like glycosyltransferase
MTTPEIPAQQTAVPAWVGPVSRERLVGLVRALWVPVTLGLIVVLAAVVRLYNLVENPPGFFADEASFGYNAYTILHTGKDEFGARLPLFFKAFGEYKLPVYIYSQVPFIAVLGLSELPVRLTSAVYGVLTIVAVYFLMRVFFQKDGPALAAAATLAVSPWHIFYSRTGLGDILVHAFWLTLAIALFVLGTRRPVFLVASALAFVFALFSYRAAWVLTPPILAVLIVLYHRELIRHWRFSVVAALILAAAGIFILVHVRSADTDRAQELSITSLDLSLPDTIKKGFENYRTQFTDSFLFDGSGEDHIRHVVPGIGWVSWWQVPFLVFGTLALLWRPTRPKLLLLALLVIYPLPTATARGGPSSSHTFFGVIPFTLITGYGVWAAAELLASVRWRPLRPVRLALAGGVLLGATAGAGVALASFLDTYHGEYRQLSADYGGWQWGPKQIVERFEALESDYDEFYLEPSFNEPGYFFTFYAPDGCAKCIVAHWDHWDPSKRQLFAMRPETLMPVDNFDVHEILYYPSGKVAWVIGEIAGRGDYLRGSGPNEPEVSSDEALRTIAEMSTAIQVNPNDVNAYMIRGSAYWRDGKFWESTGDYAKVIELDPASAQAYVNRGNVYAAAGIFDWAAGDYSTALSIDGNVALAYNNAGALYNRTLQYEPAIAQLDQAIIRAPELALPYANRAIAYLGLGNTEQALADLDRALALDPNLALARETLASAHRAQGDLNEALTEVDRALDLDPSSAEAYTERGRIRLLRGEDDRALADFEEAVSLDLDYVLAYVGRGIARLRARDAEAGVEDLEKAAMLDRAYGAQPSDRNPQTQWSLHAVDEPLIAELQDAASAVDDQALAARCQDVIAYLRSRPP